MGNNFHQYQQNEQLPLTSNQWTQERQRSAALEIQVLVWDIHTPMLVDIDATFLCINVGK